MRQELIDLILGELEPTQADALKERLRSDAQLARELAEIEALFGLMRRGDEIEPTAAMRRAVAADARRQAAAPLWQRLRELPGLARYRFQTSLGFRVAAISLSVHLVAMAILFNVVIDAGNRETAGIIGRVVDHDDDIQVQRPARSFVIRLTQRRLPHGQRLKKFGVPGQEEAIRSGLDALLARQDRGGAFGDVGETAYATLALLAEGDCSTQSTRRGRAIRAATRHLLDAARAGASHGAILAALVEDYALSFDELREEERGEYVRAIRKLVLAMGDDDISREALALASMAEFPIPAGRDLGVAAALLGGERDVLLERPATRLTATAVLARGHLSLERGRVRAWAQGLFERAVADVEARRVSAVVLLTLQAPYRL